jgi:hypothetical protein
VINLPLNLSEKGYQLIQLLSLRELERLRNIIITKVREHAPRVTSLEQYHNEVSEEEHRQLGLKKNRILGARQADEVLQFDSMRRFLDDARGYDVGKVVYGNDQIEDRPCVYFRLVRPAMETDVGVDHCDRWYNEKSGLSSCDIHNDHSLKLWIAVQTETGENGLRVYPRSHLSNVEFTFEKIEYGDRPVLKYPYKGEWEVPIVKAGDALLFTDKLLHGGLVNQNKITRVSVEISFFSNNKKDN